MSNHPEGGQPSGDQPQDPFAELFKRLGIPLPSDGTGGTTPGGLDLSAMMGQFQQMLAQFQATATDDTQSGINWGQTKAAARQITASLGPDPTPGEPQRRAVADAARLAHLWLDPATAFAADATTARPISRAEWVEESMPVWRQLVDPIVTNIARATGSMMGDSMMDDASPDDPESPMGDLGALMRPMLRQAIAMMYSMQFAQGVGKLAGEVMIGSEFGLPIIASRQVSLVSTNVEAFCEGLAQSTEDVVLYLALREAAGQRLFANVAWLGPQLIAMVEHYAREIEIDSDAITSSMDVDDLATLTPERFQELSTELTGKMFSPHRTEAQQEILGRLETLLALVEGWIDEVTTRAASAWMPDAPALAEAWRRRRGAGGPSEEVFQSLVGLQLSARRVRDAANLWALLTQEKGIQERDHYWSHPDLIPTSAQLDDPLSLMSDEPATPTDSDSDWDADLRRLLGD